MTTNASPKTRLTLKKLMLRSGFAEQFVEADVLLFIEAERVFIAQRSGLLSGLVCQFSVGIHNIGSKGVRLGRTPGLAERAPLSDKGTARCCPTTTKSRGGKIFEKTLQNLRYDFRNRGFPVCNITTVRAPEQALGAD